MPVLPGGEAYYLDKLDAAFLAIAVAAAPNRPQEGYRLDGQRDDVAKTDESGRLHVCLKRLNTTKLGWPTARQSASVHHKAWKAHHKAGCTQAHLPGHNMLTSQALVGSWHKQQRVAVL